MRIIGRFSIYILLIGVVGMLGLGCSAEPTSSELDISAIAESYTEWPSPMSEPSDQSIQLWLLCRTMTEQEAAYANSDQHGGIAVSTQLYVNNLDHMPLLTETDERTFPDGTILVKEKLSRAEDFDNPTVEALGMMIKQNSEWAYAYWKPDGTIGTGREVVHCQACHESAAATDYVFYPQLALGLGLDNQ